MVFDWYSPTVPAGPDEVVGALAGFGVVSRSRALYGYEEGVQVDQGGEVVARAFWGGVNGDRSVHVQASGEGCGAVVDVIRAEWPEHRVARADACQDYSGANAWRRLSKLALEVARKHRVKTATAGDWIGKQDGRTLYLGGRTAFVRMRVYEKGKQLGPLADPDRVRVEVQVRPQGDGKRELAVAPASQLMQTARWTASLAERLGVEAFESLAVRRPWTPSSEERMRFWLAHQYGEGLKRWGNEVGWSNLETAIDDLRRVGRNGRQR